MQFRRCNSVNGFRKRIPKTGFANGFRKRNRNTDFESPKRMYYSVYALSNVRFRICYSQCAISNIRFGINHSQFQTWIWRMHLKDTFQISFLAFTISYSVFWIQDPADAFRIQQIRFQSHGLGMDLPLWIRRFRFGVGDIAFGICYSQFRIRDLRLGVWRTDSESRFRKRIFY